MRIVAIYIILKMKGTRSHLVASEMKTSCNAGAGIYVQSSDGALPNNSFITTLARDTIPLFRCLSGSSTPYVGQLIDNYGRDITNSDSDPFSVTLGGPSDPGSLLVRSLRPLRHNENGIYTYRTPDERGNIIDFHFGLYHYLCESIPTTIHRCSS